jgi:hypothetical protein
MERLPRWAPSPRTFWIETSARKISFVRARCGNAGKDGGAERARQVVGDGKHLLTGYQPPLLGLPSGPGPRVFAHGRLGGGKSRVTGQREAHELLLIEEADAWFEYLEATRGQSVLRYKEVEPWAWARLSQRMRAIKTRRAKLRPAAEAA